MSESMNIYRAIIVIALQGALAFPVLAASFDCGKAKKPIEKLICENAELDAADARLGDVFKQVNSTFPLKGFLQLNQRQFIAEYPSCLTGKNGEAVAKNQAVQNCVTLVQNRIAELESLAKAHVYTDANGKFTQDNLAILTFARNGKNMISFWGNWMPDGFKPQPFPDGFMCNLEGELQPVKGGFKTTVTDDAVFGITDDGINISKYIMCTPRNGINSMNYQRVR